MKNYLFNSIACLGLTFLVFSSSNALAADYYWVGGSGNWSNFQNHWATSSGGSTFHVIPPTQNDDVYFDQNSFTAPGQVVTMNAPFAYCKTIDWTGVTNNPTWGGFSEVNIYGSLILAQQMQLNFAALNTIHFRFLATSPGHVVDTYGHPIANSFGTALVDFSGQGGEWSLESNLALEIVNPNYTFNILTVEHGSLITNGYQIRSSHVNFFTDTATRIDLDTSTIYCANMLVQGYDSTVVDADSATVFSEHLTSHAACYFHFAHLTGTLEGAYGGKWVQFDELELAAPQSGTQLVDGKFVFHDILQIADSGRTVEFYGSNLILDRFSIRSRPGFPIRLQGQSNFIKASGDLCFEWLYLENSTATGGANWYAGWQSSDLGGNNGWLFSSTDSCAQLVHRSDPLLSMEATWYPNPIASGSATQSMQVDFALQTAGTVTLELYDLQGRQLRAESWEMNSGQQRVAFPTGQLSAGSYLGVLRTPEGAGRNILVME